MSSNEPKALLKNTIAFLLVVLCLVAANWQYERGTSRQAKNSDIEANSLRPTASLEDLINSKQIRASEWRSVTIEGTFDISHEVLLRNRYNSEGKYGFEYLTLFKTRDKSFWVDRGWVQAGPTALSRPEIPNTPREQITITGRIRLDSALPKGSFFALPANGDLINEWNLKSKVETEDFYIDLIDGPGIKPAVPAELPELSDGPHFAYALQWLFFAGLVVYGRLLIRKR